jgi:hypothetical protein
MKIHLIRSVDFAVEEFDKVLDVLKSTSGLISFTEVVIPEEQAIKVQEELVLTDNNSASKSDLQLPTVTWEEPSIRANWHDFFTYCDYYRESCNLDKDDFVIFLTPNPNSKNWFTAFNDNYNTIFIHTDEWHNYLPCRPAYPISYLVMSQVLQKLFYKRIVFKEVSAHVQPKGCMNDFCITKSEISLKLRTADVCPDCLEEMVSCGVKEDYIIQALSLFEHIRTEMLFKQRHKFNLAPRKVFVKRSNGQLKGLAFVLMETNQIFDLNPTQSVLYLFYLNHPEGASINSLRKSEVRKELLYLYKNLSIRVNTDDDVTNSDNIHLETITGIIEKKTTRDPLFSSINRAFKSMLGNDVAKPYSIITYDKLVKKILLDRTLITYDQEVVDILGKYHPSHPAHELFYLGS